MVAPNPATLTRKTHLLCRLAALSRSHFSTTTSRVPAHNPLHINRFNASFAISKISQLNTNGHRGITPPRFGFSNSGIRSLRVWGHGGSGGGAGGGYRGSGGGGSGDGGGGGGSNWSFLSWYMSVLAKYPVMTKAFTSGLLTLVGDVVCQLVIDKVPSPDIQRTSIFTLLGLVLVGPTLHFWYLGLSKLVTTRGASGAIMRLVLDQFLFAPVFIGIFLSSLMTLEGKASNVIPKLQQEWFSAVLANWQLWIPFQFLNFRFVPQHFQVLAANVISLVWNVILSYKAHKEVLPK